MSQVINETDVFQYPSVTFCTKYKYGLGIAAFIVAQAKKHGAQNVSELGMAKIKENVR